MKFESTICPKCGYEYMEIFGDNELACKECRTHYKLSTITDTEMIEWFCN